MLRVNPSNFKTTYSTLNNYATKHIKKKNLKKYFFLDIKKTILIFVSIKYGI